MHYHLETFGGGFHPGLSQLLPFVFRKHIALAGGAVDENAFQTVAGQHLGVGGNGSKVDIPLCVKRGERGIDEPDYLFHF